MKVRCKNDVKTRKDPGFGGIVYVPHRNDFFAANYEVFKALESLSHEFVDIPSELEQTYSALAALGVCETSDPITLEVAYSGPSFLGEFPEIPSVQKPLVVNCFSTSYCPLSCIYCHADDLMKEYRRTENEINTPKGQIDIKNVISTAIMIPAMVAVITGGDPLIKPKRTIQLIEGLAKQKSLVLDTSGYGDIDELMPYLIKNNVHVRVSLDSLSKENDEWRILNTNFKTLSDISSPRENALRTIAKCLKSNLGLTVQTVVHSKNDKYGQLVDLRDGLIALGVKNWVLHVAIRGGLARKKEKEREGKSRGGVLPGKDVRKNLWKLMETTINGGLNIDIRCTDTDSSPNSVLLINSEGDLFTEGLAHNGKVKLYDVNNHLPDQFRAMWSYIDWLGHARRYLNWNPWYFNHQDLEKICYKIPLVEMDSPVSIGKGLAKTEKKYKVHNLSLLLDLLHRENFQLRSEVMQRDEYYDTKKSNLATFDYILRVRKETTAKSSIKKILLAFIGPRFYAEIGEYSQFELSFSVTNEEDLQCEMRQMRLENIWYFEKKRSLFCRKGNSVNIAVDEVPEIGYYIELEGHSQEIQNIEKILQPAIGNKETRNYRDIYIDYERTEGNEICDNEGPVFNDDKSN